MRTFHRLLIISALLLSSSFGSAQQPAVRRTPRFFTPVASVKDIMEAVLEPATEVISDAVAPADLPNGVLEKAPASDDEWTAVRNSAIVMSEGANLLVMGGRRISSGAPESATAARAARRERVELMPKIAARVARSQDRWRELAQALIVQSLMIRVTHGSTKPSLRSCSSSICDAHCTSPLNTRVRQVPHTPARHNDGMATPQASAASSIV